jgi:hypothetical protein
LESPHLDYYKINRVVHMAPPFHYLIHLLSLPLLKTKTISLLNFKLAPKIKILVI